MASTNYKSIDEYIAAQVPGVQAVLRRVRRVIEKAMPDAEEVISYQIPAFKTGGRAVLYFAGWKEHFSLYPVGDALLAEFHAELAPYKLSKGTIRFPYADPAPVDLIERIARFRAKEAAARSQPAAKPKSKRKTGGRSSRQ